MKIRTNSPTVLSLVIRLLSEAKVSVKKMPAGNEVMIIDEDVTEGQLRLILQEGLDGSKFDYDDDYVLVNGNSVWSYNRIIKEIKSIKKADNTEGISGYFYRFMHLNFTIAHGNMRGWMVEYPSFDKVLHVLDERNVPAWKTDVMRIICDIHKMIQKKDTKNALS